MVGMTVAETEKYLRTEAKKLGCTFKKEKNGNYTLIRRRFEVGAFDVLMSDMKLGNALDNCESGYWETLVKKYKEQ